MPIEAIFGIVAQLAGSFAGAALVGILSLEPDWSSAISKASPGLTQAHKGTADTVNSIQVYWWQGAIIEFWNTFFLMFVILYIATDYKTFPTPPPSALGGAIGLCLSAMIMGAGALTGCAANPFRAIGPCILNGNWFDLLVYEIWPFLGALFACVIWKNVVERDEIAEMKADEKVGAEELAGEYNK